MRQFTFWKFNPSGNTTLFLAGAPPADAALLCRQALGPLGIEAEQAGFADVEGHFLRMGGGEFCANACRAFGALLDSLSGQDAQTGERTYTMRVSGLKAPIRLQVRDGRPRWRVAACFPLGPLLLEKTSMGALARLPGIAHLLINGECPENGVKFAAARARKTHGLDNAPAAGVVWWRKIPGGFEITPYVRVRDTGVEMLESSCGSATLALAALAGCQAAIRQPGGEWLEAAIHEDGTACLEGNVELVARGELWLPAGAGP